MNALPLSLSSKATLRQLNRIKTNASLSRCTEPLLHHSCSSSSNSTYFSGAHSHQVKQQDFQMNEISATVFRLFSVYCPTAWQSVCTSTFCFCLRMFVCPYHHGSKRSKSRKSPRVWGQAPEVADNNQTQSRASPEENCL